MVNIKTEKEIDRIRASCLIVSEVLQLLGKYIRPGVTTKELDSIAEDFIRSTGAQPAFKGYDPRKSKAYPATICCSIDDEVVHGIPNGRKLIEGDIVSIDVGVLKDGFYGDGARTFPVEKISEKKEFLLKVTREALDKGIEQAVASNRVRDISHAVQQRVEQAGFSVVRELAGHGIGQRLHEEPQVPNFGEPGTGIELREGMTLAIEPMVNVGTHKVRLMKDGWTVRTQDGEPSAHFEHTVVVRKGKAEILTV
ncbi:MAG: type I methionyl aminopeptidase [Bacteroidota bacterium]